MKILVTGASGQLGCCIRKASLNSEHEFIFTDLRADETTESLDITDADNLLRTVREREVSVIINCAAYTDVNRAESDEVMAYKINEQAPLNLAEAAAAVDGLLIHISTDYVFDGTSCKPYREDMETCPVSVYGRSKLAGEKAIESSGCRYVVLRTAWLYSNYGKNFYKTMIELTAAKPEIKVVADQVGTPTCANDLAEAVVRIIDENLYKENGIYHYSNEGACSWYDFAKEICVGVGHLCDVYPCRTEDFPTPAARPHYSVLDKTKFKTTFGIEIPHWRESMVSCISDLLHQTKGK